MGAIAAAFTKGPGDAEALVEAMLRSLRHRGTKPRTLKTTEDGKVNLSVGYISQGATEGQVFETNGTVTMLDGSIFGTPHAARFAHTRLTRNLSVAKTARSLLEEPGAFACVFQQRRKLYAFRDLNGLKPLYYARSRNITAFASERKALWAIGLKDTLRANPGCLYSITERRFSETRLAHIPRPIERRMTIRQSSSRLSFLLKKSIRRITQGVGKMAVAFSGGLDSALTAFLAKREGSNVEAVSVGLPAAPELSTVEQFARELDLPITIETFSPASLEGYVRRVVWLIEEPNLMKVSVAVPLHWAAMVAARRGCTVMLCGQGSDELYGGYYKYARTLDRKGRNSLITELYRSVVDSAQVNYERDDQATAPFGVKLRTPFADLDVIKFSLSIPSEFKVRPGNDLTRKWVLRSVAKEAGLPEDIVWRRKKAIQHGTGVENAIRKLAKERGLTAEAYLLKVHEEVIRMESMP
ncbi:MAG: asparagine synthetase B [Candidatus Bathyarchaeia archaeon]